MSYHNQQTGGSAIQKRCVNLDWLEVHAMECSTEARDAKFYRSKGIEVREREYGTRVYREMFTIYGTDGLPLLEVRRMPTSCGVGGIHAFNECHLRLVNRSCYFDDAAASFAQFLDDYGYYNVRISRVDICLDFIKFDLGDDPAHFVSRYFKHRFAKINQGRITSHGEDRWDGQTWNSLSWGSPSSAVTTKLYNKTMELYDVKTDSFSKPYIRHAWFLCGFIDDWQRVTLKGERVDVWRLEFSIRSAVKGWVAINIDGHESKYQSIRNSLSVYDSRDKILVMFASLARHYFRFKIYEEGQRKDRCKDKVLFRWEQNEVCYKVGRDSYVPAQSSNDSYMRLINKLRAYKQSKIQPEIQKACEVIISAMTEDDFRADMASPFNEDELRYLRALMSYAASSRKCTVNAAMHEVKELLKLTDRTIPDF